MECQCALIETFFDYCPGQTKPWWPRTAQIGTKMMYLPSPEPVVYVVPLSHILGKLPLIPAGDYGTIPRSMHGRKDACYERGVCDRRGEPGSGSPLYYINTWLAHGLPGCRRLKNKAQFQLKWSLLVCSATRDAQSWSTAHI